MLFLLVLLIGVATPVLAQSYISLSPSSGAGVMSGKENKEVWEAGVRQGTSGDGDEETGGGNSEGGRVTPEAKN